MADAGRGSRVRSRARGVPPENRTVKALTLPLTTMGLTVPAHRWRGVPVTARMTGEHFPEVVASSRRLR